MAEQKNTGSVPPENGRSSGIKRRWILTNMSVVLGILLVLLVVAGVVVTQNYRDSVIANVQMRAETQAKTINTNANASYSIFYEYSRQAVQNFAFSFSSSPHFLQVITKPSFC